MVALKSWKWRSIAYPQELKEKLCALRVLGGEIKRTPERFLRRFLRHLWISCAL